MKRTASLVIAMILLLCSCGGVPEEAQSLVDMDTINRMYFSGLLGDWDSADGLDPDMLVSFFFRSSNAGDTWEDYYDKDLQAICYPQGVCERYVTAYFDLPKEYLRLSSYYNHDTLTYNNPSSGYGGASFIDSVETEKKGKNVLATVYRYVPVDEGESDPGPLPSYILTLTQTDDGWRFSSCKEVSAEAP